MGGSQPGVDDSQVVYEATRMIRLGAAAFVQTVTGGGPFYLYGPGFQVEITHTDPAADYPGSVASMHGSET